ncbi:MAG: KamA family radical SAM protein [Spirochaetota bacterium]
MESGTNGTAGSPAERAASTLPYGVTSYYASLARSRDPNHDPIAAQFVPRPEEAVTLPYETDDPIGDEQYRVGARVLHHYRDRILILANDRCATYCRHCFRRHFTSHDSGRITSAEIEEAASYLAGHPECTEALISGGDPLMLPDDHLKLLFDTLRAARGDLIIRLGTRIPVVQPARLTPELARMMGAYAPLWTVIHANHPREITDEFARAVGLLVDNGVPVLNQAVLLRGVNDDADTLERLFRGLVANRVKPYYLFQGDLAAGTRHFRTSIDRGLELMAELRRRLTGLAIPTYAVDLPGGAGKIPLTEASIVRREPGWYVLRDLDGNEHRYPREE